MYQVQFQFTERGYSTPPNLLAVFKGPTSNGKGERKRWGRERLASRSKSKSQQRLCYWQVTWNHMWSVK